MQKTRAKGKPAADCGARTLHGARAGRADARRRDAGDAAVHRRGAATPQMPARRRAPWAAARRPAGFVARSLTYQRVCSSLAPRQRAWEPAAKCTTYFLTDPNSGAQRRRAHCADGSTPRLGRASLSFSDSCVPPQPPHHRQMPPEECHQQLQEWRDYNHQCQPPNKARLGIIQN